MRELVAMERPESLRNPVLSVSRQISACSACRNKKIKCDGLLPACTACQRGDRAAECTNGNDQFVKGKERSYVSTLESRLDKLQRDIDQMKTQELSVNGSGLRQSVYDHQAREASNVDDLVSDFGFLSVNATARDFHGFTRDMSFARLVLAASTVHELPNSKPVSLPPRHLVNPMVQYYIDHYLALYPFISESKIFGSLEALRMGHGDAVDHWTAFLVLAVAQASKSSSQNGSKYKEAVTYLVTALRYSEMVLLPGSIQAVQMVLLLVQYSLVDPYHFEVWYLIGAAARIAIDLGLHQDLPQTVQLKSSQLDLRRRVYYSIYALDRTVSMSYRCSFTFSDDSANVARSKTGISSVAAGYVLGFREIQSSFYMKLFRSGSDSIQNTWPIICSATNELRRWEEGLPQQLQPEAVKGMLQVETLFTKILFLSPPRASKRLPDYCQLLMLQYVTEYAVSISSITGNSEAAEFLSWIDALQALFVADRFFWLLEQHAVLVFADATPDPPNPSQAGTVPPLRISNSGQDKLVGALESCQLLDSTVEYLGTKFGYSRPFAEYRTKSVYACSILQKFDSQWNSS